MESLYNIPQNWAWTVLENIGAVSSGGTPTTSEEDNFDGNIAWITPADLTGYTSQYISHGRRNISEKGLRSSSAKLLPEGTVLFSSRAPIGYVVIAINPLCTNQGFKNLTPADQISSEYLYYYLKGSKRLAESLASGTTFLELSASRFAKIPIPIAPLNEQRRIVSKIEELFSRLDEGEAALKRVQRLLTSYRQAVLKAAVTGELTKEWREANQHSLESGSDLLERILKARREQWQGRGQYQEPKSPDTSGLPALPDGWVWATPEQIMQMFGNGIPRKPADYKTNYPILRISAVRPLSVNTADIRFYEPKQNENLDSYWLKNGDLLFTRYNGSIHLVGVCGLYRGDENILHPDKIIKLRTIDFPELCKEFLEICFNVGVSRAFIRQNIKTTAGQQGIAGGDLRMTPFPLPPSAEQFEIASRAQEILSRIATLESWCSTELTRSATLRQSILKAAFSGQLVPQDPSDEPASVLLERIQAERQTVADKPTRRAKQPSQQEQS